MSQIEMHTGKCPNCGEVLQIPAHLKQFSCLYCGTRLTPAEIAPTPEPVVISETDGIHAADYYKEHVIETITNHIGIDKQMTGKFYPDAFAEYSAANEMTFRQLDAAVHAGTLTVKDGVAWYLDQLEQRWNGMSSKLAKTNAFETDKFVIAIFLVPVIRKLQLSVSESFCTELQTQWVAKYPKSPFYLGTYEDLCGGFQKKFLGLCYITTAICSFENKPDNCAELTAFRNFRDGYLRSCPDGPALISEYYDKAPGIVLHIELSQERDQKYAAIRDQYLIPCYADLQTGHLQQCKERYVSMVRALEQEYLN